MKKIIISFIDALTFITSFLFLLSSFFKLISLTCLNRYMCENTSVLLFAWTAGLVVAILLTRPLYREILALRLPLEEWLRSHRLKQ